MMTQEDWTEALELAQRWEHVTTDESYGPQGKTLGTLARAFLHLKECYDACVEEDSDD